MNKRRYLVIVGIVVVAVLISILLYTVLANHRPVITSLTAQPQGVRPLRSCQITCDASDRDGDSLSYGWWASGGAITGDGATVTWTAPESEGPCTVAVTVTDGRGGEVADYLTVSVRADGPPTIGSLAADADWAFPSGSLQVTCDATDPDADKLSYEWTTTGGDISGTGPAVNWTAPQQAGAYNVTVVVSDGYGGEDVKGLTLWVNRGAPPTIQNFIVTAQEPKYLKESSTTGCDYDVWVEREYYIECVTSGTGDGLFYEWSCDDGEISGQGSSVTWTSPSSRSVRVAVTVIVSDAAGNSVGKTIAFWIPSCSCDFG
jgi:hypothetical protein